MGVAWRYELVRGTIVAHAAPSPEHGVILVNLAGELHQRLRGNADCRADAGSGAVPDYALRNTVRIPDALIRRGSRPRVVFEVVSPSELLHKREWDQKRSDLQAVEGVKEIVEVYQDEMLAHACRRQGDAWVFESISGPKAVMDLSSVGIVVPLAALYDRITLEER